MVGYRKGWLTMEMITALAVLSIAFLPLLTFHAAGTRHVQRNYRKAVLSEMIGDRLAILRKGGWKEYGPCKDLEIEFFGNAAEKLPDGRLLLSISEKSEDPNLLSIKLVWRPNNTEAAGKVRRETFVFNDSEHRQGEGRQ